mmetsp:Transcript_31374/g.55162  ORF Transcript_31374/g.55162 Transcript_31374/m.55162 type:complete len:182 (-) Transcript_31374:308-853(-)|eukprot:CAMPEP_0197521858 /NCGR_PEP_ID=MMETSP1318-20131121/7082_1 /TAXON_ID=552666 /ORGANISM="Partenskyella glossopodia, Strain RCC365" /LENGTH=181 /DNA_ID=CAMNT_0043074007 /DNA_START=70 /DNA_END=615 /DNA_ORIENTATION=-
METFNIRTRRQRSCSAFAYISIATAAVLVALVAYGVFASGRRSELALSVGRLSSVSGMRMPIAPALTPANPHVFSRNAMVPKELGPKAKQGGRVARRAIEIDMTDPDIQKAIGGALLGVLGGIGFPIFYKLRDNADQERLKDIREMNRQQFEETGSYMTDDEIAALRPKRYLDDKEFVDDD